MHSATITVEDNADTIYKAINTCLDSTDRAEVKTEMHKNTLIVTIDAKDPTALKAAKTTAERLIETARKALQF